MSGVILSSSSGCESSRRIFGKVSHDDCILDQRVNGNRSKVNMRFEKSNPNSSSVIDGFKYGKNTIIIRYGSTLPITCGNGSIVYNRSKAIELASNKKLARRTLIEAGIATPQIIEDGNPDEIYPLIARKSFHQRGEDLYVIRDADAYDLAVQAGFDYFSSIYPKTREFRVHCAHGKILLIHEKPHPKDIQDVKKWVTMFNEDEWIYVGWNDYDVEICKLALQATQHLGLDFAGVDVMAFPTGNGHPRQVVCEVNTAPTLYNYGSDRYGMYFDWLMSSNERLEHFDFTKFTKPASFAWKKKDFVINKT